jgi:hypothetical protein
VWARPRLQAASYSIPARGRHDLGMRGSTKVVGQVRIADVPVWSRAILLFPFQPRNRSGAMAVYRTVDWMLRCPK